MHQAHTSKELTLLCCPMDHQPYQCASNEGNVRLSRIPAPVVISSKNLLAVVLTTRAVHDKFPTSLHDIRDVRKTPRGHFTLESPMTSTISKPLVRICRKQKSSTLIKKRVVSRRVNCLQFACAHCKTYHIYLRSTRRELAQEMKL